MIDPCSVETRVVKCSDINAICDPKMRPISTRKCKLSPNETCGNWVSSDWSECSRSCGNATRYRTVKCINGNICSSIVKPHEIEICSNNSPCSYQDSIIADLIFSMNKIKKRTKKNLENQTDNFDYNYDFNLINYTQNFDYNENLDVNKSNLLEYEWQIGEFSEVGFIIYFYCMKFYFKKVFS